MVLRCHHCMRDLRICFFDCTNSRGEGASQISGYVVTNVKYHLANEPSKIDIVEFNLDGPATVVKIKLVSADLNFYSCTRANAYLWRCEVNPAVDISSMDELRVIASDD